MAGAVWSWHARPQRGVPSHKARTTQDKARHGNFSPDPRSAARRDDADTEPARQAQCDRPGLVARLALGLGPGEGGSRRPCGRPARPGPRLLRRSGHFRAALVRGPRPREAQGAGNENVRVLEEVPGAGLRSPGAELAEPPHPGSSRLPVHAIELPRSLAWTMQVDRSTPIRSGASIT